MCILAKTDIQRRYYLDKNLDNGKESNHVKSREKNHHGKATLKALRQNRTPFVAHKMHQQDNAPGRLGVRVEGLKVKLLGGLGVHTGPGRKEADSTSCDG